MSDMPEAYLEATPLRAWRYLVARAGPDGRVTPGTIPSATLDVLEHASLFIRMDGGILLLNPTHSGKGSAGDFNLAFLAKARKAIAQKLRGR